MQEQELGIEIINKNKNISAVEKQIKNLFQSKNDLEKKLASN